MSKRRIAVIGVHGVSAIEENSTLTAVGDMLHRLQDPDGTPLYSPHTETETVLNVQPLAINPKLGDIVGDENGGEPGLFSFDERQKFLERYRNDTDEANLTPSHGLMRDLLRNFDPKDTKEHRLRCHRMTRQAPNGEREVDLYEMYWDDLSRLAAGFVGVFGDLYHILFHLSHIGQQTVDLAAGANKKDDTAKRLRSDDQSAKSSNARRWFWDAYMLVNTGAGRLLTIFVPLLNVLLLAVISILLPLAMPDLSQRIAAVGVLPAALMLGSGLLYWQNTRKREGHTVPVLFGTFTGFVVLGLAAALGLLWLTQDDVMRVRVLACEWHFLAIGLYILGMWAFNVRRPGAFLVSLITGIPTLLYLWWWNGASAGTTGDLVREAIVTVALNVCEVVYVALFLTWMAFSVAFLVTNILGLASWIRPVRPSAKDGDTVAAAQAERDKTRRAYWTAAISLAVPSAMFLGLTLTVWMALVLSSKSLVPTVPVAHPEANTMAAVPEKMEYRSPLLAGRTFLGLQLMPKKFAEGQPADEFMKTLVYVSATTGFPIAVGIFAVAFLLVGYVFFPSALAEVNPPVENDDGAAKARSRSMGEWLSKGYRTLIWSGVLFALMMVPFLPAYALWDAVQNGHGDSLSYEATGAVLGWFGSALAATAVTVTGLRLRFEKVSQSFRPIVEVVLDVDNHLRSLPTKNTPRARIAARYASLLRHLCRQQYEAIIIVAHSQGSVITADLLRFLQDERNKLDERTRDLRTQEVKRTLIEAGGEESWEPDLQPIITGEIPVYLLSFGCPLRQLYSLRFPHLYTWARFDAGDTPPYRPRPNDLKLARWVNLYHSGDYVGRSLWHDEQDLDTWNPSPIAQDCGPNREETCIGAGAHIRYWDSSSPQVANALDRLIVDAEPPSPAKPQGNTPIDGETKGESFRVTQGETA